jgi:hypothetical protein
LKAAEKPVLFSFQVPGRFVTSPGILENPQIGTRAELVKPHLKREAAFQGAWSGRVTIDS